MSTDDADLVALRTITTDLADALAGIEPSDWQLVTPCTDWDLRDLVDHVVGGNWYTIRVLAGDSSEDALAAAMDRFGAGPVSVAEASQSAADQRAAFETPGVLDRRWSHVAGELHGRQILRLRLHDLIAHTWDINEARRPPSSIPIPLARWGLDELLDPESVMATVVEPRPGLDELSAEDPSAAYLRLLGR